MRIPQKVYDSIFAEAIKNMHFNWYSGWEKSSGYIKSDLRGDCRLGGVRIYCEWKKKKEPTSDQMKEEIKKHIDGLLENQQHHSEQRDFVHYLLETYYVDVTRLGRQVSMSIENYLQPLIELIEASKDFGVAPALTELHNDLKNLECGLSDHGAIQQFLKHGHKRIGES